MTKKKKIIIFICIGIILIGIAIAVYLLFLKPSIVGKWKYSVSASGHSSEIVLDFTKDELVVTMRSDGELIEGKSRLNKPLYYKIKNDIVYINQTKKDFDIEESGQKYLFIKKLTSSELELSMDSEASTRFLFSKE